MHWKRARKAVVGGAATAAAALGTAMLDGNLTGAESTIALGTGLLAAAAVYGVRNRA